MDTAPIHEPYTEHHTPHARVIVVIAIVVLLAIALFITWKSGTPENGDLVPEDNVAASGESTGSFIPPDIEIELQAVRDRFARGEISMEEARRQTKVLYMRIPLPPLPQE